MSSAWEHFFAATLVLASAGPIKHRLVEAFREHLAKVEEEELPREIRDEFTSLSHTLSRVPPMRGETAIQATVRKMSDSEAGGCAVRIVGMLGVLARLQAAQRAPKLRAVGED
jgi:hypothetical protein|nr:MAG: hypothetical protein DIU80_20225 [Chloroflexota bacterium]